MYLLDTDILGNLLKKTPSTALIGKLASVPAEEQFTSSITLGEMIYGACRLASHKRVLLEQIEKLLLPNLTVLPFDTPAALKYSELRTDMEQRGILLGDAVMRIGAIALSRGLTVVTANVRPFHRIPGLNVENWLIK